jgi:hypothetical protein
MVVRLKKFRREPSEQRERVKRATPIPGQYGMLQSMLTKRPVRIDLMAKNPHIRTIPIDNVKTMNRGMNRPT